MTCSRSSCCSGPDAGYDSVSSTLRLCHGERSLLLQRLTATFMSHALSCLSEANSGAFSYARRNVSCNISSASDTFPIIARAARNRLFSCLVTNASKSVGRQDLYDISSTLHPLYSLDRKKAAKVWEDFWDPNFRHVRWEGQLMV